MVKLYICNAFVKNLADSESCFNLRLLYKAKTCNLLKNGHVLSIQTQTVDNPNCRPIKM